MLIVRRLWVHQPRLYVGASVGVGGLCVTLARLAAAAADEVPVVALRAFLFDFSFAFSEWLSYKFLD